MMDDCIIDRAQQGSINDQSKETELVGWTKVEKFDLLQCLKIIGSRDLITINRQIPTKSTEQIQSAIDYYKAKAFQNRNNIIKKGGRPRSDTNVKPSLPLSKWAKFLTDNVSFDELQTEIATALRIIAEFDNIPQAVCTDYVDFRKAYHLLANAVEGKDLQDDKFINMLITKSIVETALTSKVFLQTATVKQLLDHIEIKNERDVKNFLKPVANKEIGIVQHLADQKNYNPMNIPMEYLKPTAD